MGVYHLAGLGASAGAITVPLTYIYFALRDNDNELFTLSGELDNEYENKGIPEALILFTSKDVIDGKRKSDIIDNLCNVKDGKSVPLIIKKYINKLISKLELHNRVYGEYGVKYFYCVAIDINNFDECLKYGYVTMKALSNKEVWCNMIAGSNILNTAILLSSYFTGTPHRFYYYFLEVEQTKYIHPPQLSIKDNVNKVKDRWLEIPPLIIGFGKLLEQLQYVKYEQELYELIQQEGYDKQFVAKLRGRWITIKDNRVEYTPMFMHTLNKFRKFDRLAKGLDNISKWKKYLEKEGRLYDILSLK